SGRLSPQPARLLREAPSRLGSLPAPVFVVAPSRYLEKMSVWVCSACGRRVPLKVDTCRCGAVQPEPVGPKPDTTVRLKPDTTIQRGEPGRSDPGSMLSTIRSGVFVSIVLFGVVAGWRFSDRGADPAPAGPVAAATRPVIRTPPATPPAPDASR